MTKYRAKPTMIDGFRFASKAEARRYGELLLLQRAGEISNLEIQPPFDLAVNGVKVGRYTADFAYDSGGKQVVEDVKSPATAARADYRLRKRLMLACHGIEIVEVMR